MFWRWGTSKQRVQVFRAPAPIPPDGGRFRYPRIIGGRTNRRRAPKARRPRKKLTRYMESPYGVIQRAEKALVHDQPSSVPLPFLFL